MDQLSYSSVLTTYSLHEDLHNSSAQMLSNYIHAYKPVTKPSAKLRGAVALHLSAPTFMETFAGNCG